MKICPIVFILWMDMAGIDCSDYLPRVLDRPFHITLWGNDGCLCYHISKVQASGCQKKGKDKKCDCKTIKPWTIHVLHNSTKDKFSLICIIQKHDTRA